MDNSNKLLQEQYLDLLHKWWGYESFRPMQLEAMLSLGSGVDTLVLMPTGGGKSLLYQVPTMASDGLCIVVTPLIALMKDQVDRLRFLGIPATAVHSGMTKRQIDYALDNCVYGDMKFLYIAPERIETDIFRLRVGRMKVSFIAVDEAHCISQWGYDFRPSYLKIAQLRKLVPGATFIALTASATDAVVEDIQRHLEYKQGRVIRTSFARANLSYALRRTEDKQQQLLRIAKNVAGCGIVYVRTRENAENVARLLNEQGIAASYYHGGLNYILRNEKQEAWVKGEARIMVATNAFGMGIDKADVRFVVHYELCDSLEAYYQEAGRAGRDGTRAYAVMLYSDNEQARFRGRFQAEYPPIDTIKRCYEAIFNSLQIGIGDGKYAAMEFNLYDFSKSTKLFGSTIVNSISILQQNGYMTLTDAVDRPARVMFMVARDELYKIRIERQELDHILRIILRLYDGVFHNFVPIDLGEIASVSGYKHQRVMELLKKLWELRIIRYMPSSICSLLILNEERLPIDDVVISPESYKIRKDMAEARLANFFVYADNRSECRSVVLQRYFGEEDAQDCGVCDICLEKKRAANMSESELLKGIEQQVIALVTQRKISLRDLAMEIKSDPSRIPSVVDRLIGEGRIRLDENGYLSVCL